MPSDPAATYPEAERILADLVAFPTVSRDSNLQLLDYVRGHFEALGGRVVLLPDAGGAKANLIASLGPEQPGGLGLSGHSDVVPVDGQDWHSDPFCMQTQGDRLVGRGVCDMKGFPATVLALLPQLAKMPLRRPLHLLLTHDEEVGCLGAHRMAQLLDGEHAPRPDLMVVGEPSGMRLLSGHKGAVLATTRVRGHEVHSSHPQEGVSAVEVAAGLIGWLKSEAVPLARDERFDPQGSSLAVNMVQGGTAHNIMALDCSFTWELRTVPGDDGQAVLDAFAACCEERQEAMRRVHPACAVETQVLVRVPGMAPCCDSPAEELVRGISGDNAERTAAFATEAGIFQQQGIPTVILGPGHIEQAHQPNEWLAREQLAQCRDFLLAAVQRHCCGD